MPEVPEVPDKENPDEPYAPRSDQQDSEGTMIRIDMIRRDPWHSDKSQRHSQASCEVAGKRYEAVGPGPIYRLSTLLWLHGHGGAEFEVWADVSLTGRPGGLAMTGRVRNWARLVEGKLSFNKNAPWKADFSPHERNLIEQTAGTVTDASQKATPRSAQARTARSCHNPVGSPPEIKAALKQGVSSPPQRRPRKKRTARRSESRLEPIPAPEVARVAPLLPPQTPGKVQGYGPLPEVIDMPPIPGWLLRRKNREAA